MAGSTCVHSAFAARCSRLICARVKASAVVSLNSLPLMRGRVSRRITEKPPRSISPHSVATMGWNCSGALATLSSSLVKERGGIRPTSSANMENRQRVESRPRLRAYGRLPAIWR